MCELGDENEDEKQKKERSRFNRRIMVSVLDMTT